MSDNKKEIEALKCCIEEVMPVLKETNNQARKRNRLAKKQYQQSKLNYEQVERQYLIEKSRLQPTFRLSVTELLVCEPDFVNDPEQASEAKFLDDRGIKKDQRALRIKVQVKGDAQYMQPSIVIEKTKKSNDDDRMMAMNDLLYFVDVSRVVVREGDTPYMDVFFVYRDKTTLPVVHKYKVVQRYDSALLRWDASLLDTIFVSSHKGLHSLNNAEQCAALFTSREGN